MSIIRRHRSQMSTVTFLDVLNMRNKLPGRVLENDFAVFFRGEVSGTCC
jgi:hypothetical protein